MPQRSSSASPGKKISRPRGDFRRRYDEIESKRAELVARLHALGEIARSHPGYKRALTLLNDTFRNAKLPQRLAVLQAAAWLIGVLERATTAL